MPTRPVALLLSLSLVIACADEGSTSNGATRGTGPGDWGAGDYPEGVDQQTYLTIDGVAGQSMPRQYKVHVPASYDPNTPTPLLFCFHGLGQNAVMFCVDGAGMVEKSDAEGFLLVMPNGFSNSWNGGTCCGTASTSELDDVALVRAILDEVGTHVNVDLNRVYATGLSNGGYMSFRLACEAADVFAAIAPGSGTLGINSIGGGTNASSDFTECNPSEPVAVLQMHGTSDGLVSYDNQEPSVARFAEVAGCDMETTPATQPLSGGDTTCVTHAGCDGDVEVTSCTVDGGGHVWFGSEDCGTGAGALGCGFVGANSDTLVNTDAAWDFLRRFHK